MLTEHDFFSISMVQPTPYSPSSSLQFRDAHVEDIPELKQLALLSYGTLSDYMGDNDASQLLINLEREEMWQNVIKRSKGFVCEKEGVIVGMAFLVPHGNPWDIFQREWSYIRLVGVHPDFRGKGIARQLVLRCISFAIDTHESTIALHTSEWMKDAMHIYESFGFKVIKEIEPRYGCRYWLYLLQL